MHDAKEAGNGFFSNSSCFFVTLGSVFMHFLANCYRNTKSERQLTPHGLPLGRYL